MAAKYTLKQISPKDITFNKQNPRGETPEQIHKDTTFEQLKDSVAQFGVLVPIVVHENKDARTKPYFLIDGERRLRAAIVTNQKKIPAHIANSDNKMDEFVQAFHIHMLRKQWDPVAIARAFKHIKEELKKMPEFAEEKTITEELRSRTGCTNKQLEDLQRSIRYSDDVLKEVDEGKIKWSHIVQFEASFIEQLKQHYPSLLKKLGEKKYEKYWLKRLGRKLLMEHVNLYTM